jgi:hypothetical protein
MVGRERGLWGWKAYHNRIQIVKSGVIDGYQEGTVNGAVTTPFVTNPDHAHLGSLQSPLSHKLTGMREVLYMSARYYD